jgi:hypothetical protein
VAHEFDANGTKLHFGSMAGIFIQTWRGGIPNKRNGCRVIVASGPAYARMIESIEPRIAPATFVVTSLADAGAGSLRNAIELCRTPPFK